MTLDSLQLETPRLLLRLPRAEDLDPWAEMMADEETARYIGGTMVRSVTWRVLMTMIGSWHTYGFAMFSVCEKTTGRWVGRVGPWMPEGWPGPEVGWAIVRDCWRRGYAAEAAVASVNWAFDHLGWSRVIHSIDPANTASQAVARKLRSQNFGPGSLPAPFQDARVDIWGQSRAEWQRNQMASRSI
jgi:RimJ/RimL family protein N-acetyltransferase